MAENDRDFFRSAVLAVDESGNGRTLTGLVIPYGQFAEITDHMGHYQEQIAPGAFTEALRTSKPKMFFEHGKDVRIGHTPIGSFEKVWEEADGVHVRSHLFSNQLVQPLIDAARSGDLSQWSVHYRTRKDGSDESWTRSKGWDVRTVNHVRQIPEISLVNFGAYETTVSVRSLDQLTGRSDAGSADGGGSVDEAAAKLLEESEIRDREWRMRKQRIG